MSFPNHLTSNINDAFFEYVSIVPDYSPASPGKTYSSASNNLTDVIPPTSSNFSLFHDDPYISIKNAYATFTPSPIPIPPPIIKPPSESLEFFLLKELRSPRKQKQNQYFQDYKMGESSHDSTLEQHEKQIEEVLNHLDELPLDRIKQIEDVVEGLVQRQVINTKAIPMPPNRSSTSEASTMSQEAIRKLVADNVAAALETQTATMAEVDNSIRDIPVAKRGNYKEFISCQTFYFNGNDLKTYVRRFQELAVLYPNMVPNNEKLMEAFINGLPRSIEGNVTTSKPQTLEEAINIAQKLMDQVIKHNSIQGTNDHKRKFEDKRNTSSNNNYRSNYQNINNNRTNDFRQQQNRRPETFRSYAATPTENRRYTGNCPLCQRCTLHHTRPCTIRCGVCNKKDKKFVWGKDQEMAFQILKQKLCEAPILALPEGNDDFVVYCDASNQELLTDYDCEIRYHPGKANVVADALRRKRIIKSRQVKPLSVRSLIMTIHSKLPSQILEAQTEALKEENVQAENLRGMEKAFEIRTDGTHCIKNQSWLPLFGNLRNLIMHESHKSKYSIRPGSDKMYHDLKKLYWWPNMKEIIAKYVGKCLTCSRVKTECQKPSGLLIQPKFPIWKWERITMDFVTKLPRTSNGHDTIWVIVDHITKSAHFIPTRETESMDTLTWLYIKEIISGHGVTVSIIPDRESHFTSRFWQSLQKALGTHLDMSTTYHPETDGQSERTIQTLEDMLQDCDIDFGKGWERHLPLVEFSYNNSYHASIKAAPFEALYG
nr:putative reverse transcriptase domain, ribonuclease H-like domain, aspartic peptidase domain protein [Tanacetum cinerariifolium]